MFMDMEYSCGRSRLNADHLQTVNYFLCLAKNTVHGLRCFLVTTTPCQAGGVHKGIVPRKVFSAEQTLLHYSIG